MASKTTQEIVAEIAVEETVATRKVVKHCKAELVTKFPVKTELDVIVYSDGSINVYGEGTYIKTYDDNHEPVYDNYTIDDRASKDNQILDGDDEVIRYSAIDKRGNEYSRKIKFIREVPLKQQEELRKKNKFFC